MVEYVQRAMIGRIFRTIPAMQYSVLDVIQLYTLNRKMYTAMASIQSGDDYID